MSIVATYIGVGRCSKLRRSDMFIVHESNFVRLKPRRGGTARLRVLHTAPMELAFLAQVCTGRPDGALFAYRALAARRWPV